MSRRGPVNKARSSAASGVTDRRLDAPRKVGWQVRGSVADAVRRAVEAGAAESQNAFVERALIRELRELRRARVYEAYASAARDPEFLDEMGRVTHDFEPAANDGLEVSEE
jgi:hypothetical protein